nr:stage III sporulation protein AF [uncultured Acetatifactor sp.]
MQNSLFQAICRMGIFMICAQAVIHFRPKEVYEKYLKLMVSVMVLIQVFLPVGNFLLGDGRQDALKALGKLGQELEQSMQEANEDAAAADELLEKMTLEEIRKRLEGQEEERDEEIRGGEEQERENQKEGEPAREGQNSGISEISVGDIEPVVIDPIEPVQSGQGGED